MSVAIKLSWNRAEAGPFGDKKLEHALVRALGKAGGDAVRALKAASSRSVRARKRFKVSRVNRSLPLTFPKQKKTVGDLVWRMDVASDPVPLADFPHTQTKRGVTVAVGRGGRKLIKSAFVATMSSGHTGIFVRATSGMQGPMKRKRGRKSAVWRVGRLPVQELFTTRVSDVFDDEGMLPAVQQVAQKTFSNAFARLFKLELGK